MNTRNGDTEIVTFVCRRGVGKTSLFSLMELVVCIYKFDNM